MIMWKHAENVVALTTITMLSSIKLTLKNGRLIIPNKQRNTKELGMQTIKNAELNTLKSMTFLTTKS